MFNGKSLPDFANFFSLNNYKDNDRVTLNYFYKNEINIRMVETSNHATINIYPQ